MHFVGGNWKTEAVRKIEGQSESKKERIRVEKGRNNPETDRVQTEWQIEH